MKIKPIIGGNWKMNKTVQESKLFIDDLLKNTKNLQEKIDIVILPSYTCISAVSNALKGKKVNVGAQNMYFEEKELLPVKFRLICLLMLALYTLCLGIQKEEKYLMNPMISFQRKSRRPM